MDNIDFGLCMMLVVNSRIPYRELAEIFNMSTNSIHKRIKSMVDLGVIQNFNTKIGMVNFPNALSVLLFGTTEKENKADCSEGGRINNIIFATAKCFISGQR